MNKQKAALTVLVLLISIKFVFIPWGDWVMEQEIITARLSNFDSKQQQVIDNESLISDNLIKHQNIFSNFVGKLPTIKSNDKANTLWFSLVDTNKKKGLKVYRQRVEFEEYVTDNIGYVTGTFYISGAARDVLQALVALETQAPAVFLEKVKFIRNSRQKNEQLIVQIYLRYWFTQASEIKK